MPVARLESKEWSDFLTTLYKLVEKPEKLLRAAFATRGFRAIIENFRDEKGPDGAWPQRSDYTQKMYADIKSGLRKPPEGFSRASFNPTNKLLQLTGNLRKSIMPASLSKQSEMINQDTILIFSPVAYSGHHDEGDPSRNLPARPFMWLSEQAREDMAGIILNMAAGEA